MSGIGILVWAIVVFWSVGTADGSWSVGRSPENVPLKNDGGGGGGGGEGGGGRGGEGGGGGGGVRVNYSSLLGDTEGGVEGLFTSGVDLGSIQSILRSLRLLTSRRDIRDVIPRPQGVNEACYDETLNFVDSLLGQAPSNRSDRPRTPNWALQMFDAFGKPGSGVLEGSLQWVGTYQECLDVHAHIPAGTQFGSRVLQNASEFDTRYCRVEILLDPDLWKHSSYASTMNKFWQSDDSPDLVLNWGVCLPRSCQGPDVYRLLSQGLLASLKVKVQDAVCYQKHSNIHQDIGAITVIVLLSVFGSVVIACTVMETFWHYTRVNGDGGQQHTKGGEPPLLKDNTDVTLVIPPPPTNNGVDKLNWVSNGRTSQTRPDPVSPPTPTDTRLLGNGDAGKAHCNGGGVRGKNLTDEKDQECGHAGQVNGIEGKLKGSDSENYQLNVSRHETSEREDFTLEVEREIPMSGDGKTAREKDHRKVSSLQDTRPSRRDGFGPRIVKAFSMRMNLIRLLKTSGAPRPGVIRCLEGMRVVSMLWIILGHTYTFGAVMDNGNLLFANTVEVARTTARLSFSLVTGATFAVDTFFLMSGLLVTMLTLKDLKKNRPSCGFWGLFYFHRIWRLTPVYTVVLMFCIFMYDHTVSGPLKSMPLKEYSDCHSKWWSHLLYINNLYQPQQKCMTWTWYLAVDMQLFAIAPIIIYVLHRSIRVGLACLLCLIAVGMLSAFVSQYTYFGQFVMMDQIFTSYWQHVYIVPWTRIGAFAVGMFTGVLLHTGDQKPAISKPKALGVWMVLAAVAFFIILIPHHQWQEGSTLWPQSVQALYEALSRPGWAVCVATVVYLCHTGRGGVANNILSWPGFQPFARITYAVYLVHPVVMTFFVYSRNTPVFLQDTTIMYQYVGNVVFSYLFGTVLCIMFESPIMTLEKILLGSR